MSSTRTAKAIADRLDHNYFARPTWRRVVRRALIVVFCAGTLVFWGAQARQGDQTMYSPGPLASVHSMWDGNNCASCHEPQPDGGFSQIVSDNACTKCHDGAVHHPNQTTLVSFGADKAPLRSADCTACHSEHRGHDQLVSRLDTTCTQCHADLPANSHGGATHMQPRVTAFAPGDHPPFGRSLTADRKWSSGAQPLRDPTPLRFNHQKHLDPANADTPTKRGAYVPPAPGMTENCTQCHQPTADRLGGQDRASIAPVSYELHCATCHIHKLELLGVSVPHESLSVALPYASSFLQSQYRQELKDKGDKLLEIKDPRKPFGPKKKKDPEQWISDKVTEATTSLIGQCRFCHSLSDDAAKVGQLQMMAGPPLNQRVVAQVAAAVPAATAPATTSPSTQPALPLSTLPTGYAGGPRHWFVHSKFDHRAHRAISCTDCHTLARTSRETSDVIMPTMESCARCHVAQPAASAGSAGASCLTCHDFHNRNLERAVSGHLHAPD